MEFEISELVDTALVPLMERQDVCVTHKYKTLVQCSSTSGPLQLSQRVTTCHDPRVRIVGLPPVNIEKTHELNVQLRAITARMRRSTA